MSMTRKKTNTISQLYFRRVYLNLNCSLSWGEIPLRSLSFPSPFWPSSVLVRCSFGKTGRTCSKTDLCRRQGEAAGTRIAPPAPAKISTDNTKNKSDLNKSCLWLSIFYSKNSYICYKLAFIDREQKEKWNYLLGIFFRSNLPEYFGEWIVGSFTEPLGWLGALHGGYCCCQLLHIVAELLLLL